MKKKKIIMSIIMVTMATACSPVAENTQPQLPVTIVETTVEVIETPAEIVETNTEPILMNDTITEDNLKSRQEPVLLDILASDFQSKVELALKDFVEKNAKNEFSFMPTTLDYKESFIATTTIPSIDGREEVNAFTYTFAVERLFDGSKEGAGIISVIFVVDDGEFKVVEIATELS